MGLYVICSKMKRRVNNKTIIAQHMQVVVTGQDDTAEGAYHIFVAHFKGSVEAQEGWELFGQILQAEIHQGHLREWSDRINPAPAKKTHLRLVKT